MRRLGLFVVSVLMLMCAGTAVAQEATPTADADHPVVGSWELDREPDNPTNPVTLAVFSADGVYFQVEPVGEAGTGSSVGVGAWEATGDTTADMTFVIVSSDGFTVKIRASLDATDGHTFSGSYTFELIEPDGTSSGEVGPGPVEGTRIAVEPQGTPVGSMEDVMGEPAATPAG